MLIRITRYAIAALLLVIIATAAQPAWATLPTPSQPILVVQESTSADPYQNFVPELLTTEGLNGFQTAQLGDLTASFLSNYDVVVLPHLSLTATQATLFQNYVNAGGTLVGFRPDLQLANVFGVSSLGTTLSEGWLKIDTTTSYGSGLDGTVMKFHGLADLYVLNGARSLATLYSNATTATVSPASAVYTYGTGKAVLFSFDLTQSNVLMRQGNPAWAGYPNNHDGNNTMRASQMFMNQGTGQFWNDLGDGALNDIPQADIQLRLFSNAVTLTNAVKRPLPRLWYYPNQNRSVLLMTADEHAYNNDATAAISELNAVQSAGGKDSIFLLYPYGLITPDQVNSWLFTGHAVGVHFDDTAEVDASDVGGSAASWSGMQSVIANALSSFVTAYPTAPTPVTTRDHYLIWVSNNAAGTPDQTAQAKLFQSAGIQLDTSYTAFPNRWGYMGGTGLPMKFLDTAAGTIIPVYEQPTQYEDDVQLGGSAYSLQWDLPTAQAHYQQTLSDSLTKYNSVVTMLFHPDSWSSFAAYAQTALQYAQANSIPMYSTVAWLQFWQARAATTLSLPSYTANTLSFTATGAPSGLTVTVPYQSGANFATAVLVDGVAQNFAIVTNQGVAYAAVTLASGTHSVSATYSAGAKIVGAVSPASAAAGATSAVQGGSISQTIPVASDGTFVAGPYVPGTYTITPSSSGYYFSPWSRTVTLNGVDVGGVNFAAQSGVTGETLFTTQVPAIPGGNDGVNYELGTALQSDVPGYITGVRYWKAAGDTGLHTGKIWSNAGALLTSVPFANETDSGWQQQALATPLAISANTKYIVSVNTAAQFYVATVGGLASQIVNQDLSSIVGNNGVFGSAGAFPNNSFNGNSYFRDVFFTPSSGLISVSLNPTSVVVGSGSTGTVTLSGPAPSGGAKVTLSSDTGSVTVPASVTVPTGAMGATFSVSTSAASVTTATIGATYDVTRTALLTLIPSVSSVTVNPSTIAGGGSSTGTVTFNAPAPAGGTVVSLASDNPSAAVPSSVTVAAGAMTATFSISTVPVPVPTPVNISATDFGTMTAVLTIENPAIANLTLYTPNLAAGTSSTGSITISSPAPLGGATVALTSDLPTVSEIEGVYSLSDLPAGGSVDWASFGPEYTTINSGTLTPVNGIPGLNMTLSNAGGGQMESLVNCDFGGDCAWYGNFASGARVLWVNGTYYSDTGWWAGNGPLTIQFSSPQRGIGFQAMGDETGPFTATVCAYNSSSTLLGCVPFTGNGTGVADGSAAFMGVYDDTQEISTVVIDAGGQLYPHDFGISRLFITGTRRTFIPATVSIPAGATAVGFPINATTVAASTPVNITATYNGTRSNSLTLVPAELSTVTATPSTVLGGTSLTATVTLTGKAAAGGSVVALSADNPVSSGVQFVNSSTALPHDGTVTWTDLGPSYTGVPSGTVVPIPGAAGSTVTISNSASQSLYIYTNCPAFSDCGFSGNFVPADPLLWVSGSYDSTGTVWTGYGPITLAFNNPQRGVGFNVMADEGGPFTDTVCAYDASNNLLGCKTYNGNGVALAGGTNGLAVFTGIYDDKPEIAKVTIDGGGALYPHDFAIGPLTVDSTRRMVPPSVTVQAGATTATFPVNTDTVNQVTTVTIGGNYLVAQTGTLTVTPPTITSFTLNPSTVLGGASSTATLTFGSPAPVGSVVTLSSDTAAAVVPSSILVPEGATTATFAVTTSSVGAITTANLTATYGGPSTKAALTINPSAIASVSLAPNHLTGGGSSTGTVTLNDPAPAGGALVTLSSDSAAVVVPASVMVASGATATTFPISTNGVNSVTTANIRATYNSTQSAALTINPPALASVSLNPTSVTGGSTSTGTVTLNGPAPTGGSSVMLSSDNASATVPSSVTVVAGALTATFTVNTASVASVAPVTITGTCNGTQTASLTVNPPTVFSVVLNPAAVTGGTSSTGTVTLSGPAAPGGTVVTLSSDNVSATVPSSVTVGAGATTATFAVNTTAVAITTTANIGGAFNGSQSAPLTINAPTVASAGLTPNSVIGSNSSTGTVSLNGPAPAGGSVVSLSSDNAAATVVTNVTVAAGATAATFTVNTTPVTTAATATITETYNGTQTASLTINPPALASVVLNPTSVIGSSSSTGTVTLNGPAPTGGATVTLASDNTSATVPASVTVPTGATTATFTVNTTPVAAAASATISATYNGTLTASLTVNPPAVSSVALSPATVTGGTNSTGTVTLSGPAPTGGSVVTLSSDNASATVSASVTVAGGAITATFTVNTTPVATATTATISGTYNGTQTASLTVNPPALISVSMNPATVTGGTSSTGTVTLNGPAPAGGAVVTLSSGNGSATLAANVTITAGTTTATFTVNTTSVASVATATITGTYNGVQTASLMINPPALASVTLNPLSVIGATISAGTVTLNGPAPAGGATVLLSSNSGSATLAASVTIAAGATTTTFTVSTTAVAAAAAVTISGTYNGTQTASLTVNPPAASAVALSPATVIGSNSSTGTVTLNGPAPAGGATITLSSDNASATVPASVTVAAGATTATFSVNTTAVATATTANISAAYNGTQSASLTINPPAMVSVALNPTSVTGSNTSTGTVTLNGPAPAGGATVVLSSDNAAATVPTSVTVAGGATTATFTVNTTAVASATVVTIGGAYNGTQTASLTINPPVLLSVALNPTGVVGGNSSTGTVTLNDPAPAGGSVVTLSSNSGAATASASVTVAAGNTTANFTVNTVAVGSITTATIGGTYNGTQSAPLTINPPVVSSVALNPATVTGGTGSTGTVTLSSAAPAGGAVVSLSSDNGSATVPSTVTVAAGATTATFAVNTIAVGSVTTAHVSATFNGTQSAALTINPPVLASVSVNPIAVIGGGASTGTVTLGSAAPAGGAIVTLSSNNGSATVPASVTVAAGATTATFTVSTAAVASTTIVTIGGTFGVTQTASLTINPPAVSSVAVNPTSVVGGNSLTGTVTLNGPAPTGGTTVSLSSNSGAAQVPTSVTVLAGATTANFTVTTSGVASTTTATITAGGTQTAALTINPAALSNVTLNPTSVTGGTAATGTVTLTGQAPTGGTVVTLSSSLGSATVPASTTVLAGASTANFTVTTTAVAATATPTITATLSGVQKTAGLTINPPAISSVSMNPASVNGGTSSTGTVTLNGPAPTGNIVVTLSGNSTAANTPASVTVLAGATTANFTDTTIAVGTTATVTITATLNGTATTTLTVNAPTVTGVTMNPTAVNGGTNSTGTVTLSSPAPTGGAVVTMSDNNSAASVPASVTVLAGATTATFTVTTSTVGSAVVVTITAAYNGSKTATLTINPPPVTGLSLNPTPVVGGNNSTGTVTIQANAPTGGVVVNLSSNNAAATVPANVTIAAGSRTATFTVTTSGVSSTTTATITATGNGTATANLNVNPAALSAVSMSPSTVTGGTSSSGTVTLTGSAPSGGIVVALSDNNNATATTPMSVTVPAGSSSATFTVTTVPVATNTNVTITATYNTVNKTATLTVDSPGVTGVSVNPTTVTGSQSSTGTVTLNSPAMGTGAVVSLSANGSASVPATVTVPTGSTTANFTVTTTSTGANTSSTITATLNGTANATLTIDAPQVLSITLNPATVKGGSANSTATVTLNAPAAGNTPQRTVTLSSSNTNAATVPASITFAAGQTSMQFTVTSKVVTTQATSTISATMNGGTQTAVITVTP
jgi:hypothetical protein